MTDATEAEFATMATWTADAVETLGPDHALPAACRGSGSPAALAWLVDRMGVEEGSLLLDVGAGMGGPAAFARDQVGAVPIGVEPEHAANRASQRLFALPSLTATAELLPIRSRSCASVWALGVLSTASDPALVLREAMRVLAADGRLGLLVYLRQRDELSAEPEGTHFLAEDGLHRHLRNAGLHIVERQPAAAFDSPDAEWDDRAHAVESWIEERHRHDEAWAQATENEQQVSRLLAAEDVIAHLFVLRPA